MRDYLPHGSAVACRVLAIASGVVFAVGSVPPSAATTQFKLSVSRQGYGSGTVTSAPGGINCGSTCSHKYDSGTEVTLTAHPNSNSHLDHWSACSGSAPTCKVTISEARTVIASFARTRYHLTVSKTGSGSGHVTSDYSGISCNPYCSASYDSPTQVTLTATPGPNSTFDGWSGDCSGTGTCRPTMNKAHSVTAKFTAHYALSVSRQGYGSGTVTSAPGGINCGSTCSHKYDSGTEVTLTAHPNSNSHLDHWSACSGSAPTCKVTISEARAVIASFARTRYRLYVAKTGSGGGTVTSSPGGIGNCSPYCSHDYDPGTHVTLTAHPDSNSTFAGWSGDCTGTGTCHVTMSQGRSVTAHFTKMRLSVSKTGSGGGTVASSPGGINCGSTCSHDYDPGTQVTLTAYPDSNSTFAGWSGCSSTSGATCRVTMTQARSVSTNFATIQHRLSVSKTGSGGGTVASSPGGIYCGFICSHNYDSGTQVTLTARPGSNSMFAGWSGACKGTGTCQVTMTQARSVSANFATIQHLLSVSKSGSGDGTVTSSPAGVDCGSSCSHAFTVGTQVTLTAKGSLLSHFAGWSGDCSGTGGCTVTMSQARSVTAQFNRFVPPPLP